MKTSMKNKVYEAVSTYIEPANKEWLDKQAKSSGKPLYVVLNEIIAKAKK